MMIEASVEGVRRFLKENDDLIKEIKEAGQSAMDILKGLADRVKANRDATEELLGKVDKIPFTIAKKSETKTRQAKLLQEIEETRKKIHKYQDDPTMQGLFETNLATLYLELGNTRIEESVAGMIVFTQQEVDELRVLLRRATLDAEARQRKADVLDAAVQLSKVALRLAVKLTA